jgi:hypothetical protein
LEQSPTFNQSCDTYSRYSTNQTESYHLPNTLEILYNNDGSFQPAQLPLEVLKNSRRLPRSILNSTLFVNGERVTSNTMPPYGSFVLNLADYVDSTELRLEVRLQDEFGLQGRTPIQTIALDVLKPETDRNGTWFSSPWLWIGLLLLAGLVAFLIFRSLFPKIKSLKR